MGIQIMLVDDHAIIRQGLRSLIESLPDMEVIGEAENGQIAVDLVRERQPDIVITDVTMPSLNGMEATRQITQMFPKIKVIGLSGHTDHSYIIGMLKAGASAYVLKQCLFDELFEAIQIVSQGGTYLSQQVIAKTANNDVQLLSESADSP